MNLIDSLLVKQEAPRIPRNDLEKLIALKLSNKLQENYTIEGKQYNITDQSKNYDSTDNRFSFYVNYKLKSSFLSVHEVNLKNPSGVKPRPSYPYPYLPLKNEVDIIWRQANSPLICVSPAPLVSLNDDNFYSINLSLEDFEIIYTTLQGNKSVSDITQNLIDTFLYENFQLDWYYNYYLRYYDNGKFIDRF